MDDHTTLIQSFDHDTYTCDRLIKIWFPKIAYWFPTIVDILIIYIYISYWFPMIMDVVDSILIPLFIMKQHGIVHLGKLSYFTNLNLAAIWGWFPLLTMIPGFGHSEVTINYPYNIYIYIHTGWWFQLLWKILVSWDDYSQYMEKMFKTNQHIITYTGWRFQPLLENISQLGWLFPIYGKIKNGPNHQPEKKKQINHQNFQVPYF